MNHTHSDALKTELQVHFQDLTCFWNFNFTQTLQRLEVPYHLFPIENMIFFIETSFYLLSFK